MSRKRRRKRYTPVEHRLSNEVFDARPEEILALRRTMRWSRMSLGSFCGVYCNSMRDDCYTVYRWERGLSRPHAVHRSKMVHLVELARDQYLAALRDIRLREVP